MAVLATGSSLLRLQRLAANGTECHEPGESAGKKGAACTCCIDCICMRGLRVFGFRSPSPDATGGQRRRPRTYAVPDVFKVPREHERRTISLAAAHFRCTVHTPTGLVGEGMLWDVSRGGVCLLLASELELDAGSPTFLQLQSGFDASVLEFDAVLCWLDGSTGKPFAGFAFHNCTVPEGCFLDRFLA
jgi:hypothetical protein